MPKHERYFQNCNQKTTQKAEFSRRNKEKSKKLRKRFKNNYKISSEFENLNQNKWFININIYKKYQIYIIFIKFNINNTKKLLFIWISINADCRV